ncbi:MAG: hypothetical protein J5829_10210 [Lachnospiraceae bacterium]|nr:hypothetical protein [Lachnospiraceae bacterium]
MKNIWIMLMLCILMAFGTSCSVLPKGRDVQETQPVVSDEVSVAEEEKSVETEPVDYDELEKEMQQAAAVNPWGDTQSVSVAEEYSGVSFTPIDDEYLPEGVELQIYRYMEDIFEARYEGGGKDMTIRKSNNRTGLDLSGDYSEYSKKWAIMANGMAVTCKGDGTLINSAAYDNETGHYSILCNPGEEGTGLSEDEVQKLIEGMDVPAGETEESAEAKDTAKEENQSPAPEKKQNYTFRTPELLLSHFTKHGIDMGFTTPEAYEAAASRVVTNPAALHKTEAEDGDDVYYIENTNEFVVVSRDGFIRTYFNPDNGKRYFDKQ